FCHCFILFFFQAEDGIRDFHVTGVQTCALPISMREPLVMMCSEAWVLDPRPALRPWATAGKMAAVGARPRGGTRKSFHWSANVRSEERRVGKECRSGWQAYHVENRACGAAAMHL